MRVSTPASRDRSARRCHVALCALVLVAACRGGSDTKQTSQPATALQPGELVTVTQGTVATGPLIAGTLEAARGATLAAELGGTVREIGPELGERVTKGTVLVR